MKIKYLAVSLAAVGFLAAGCNKKAAQTGQPAATENQDSGTMMHDTSTNGSMAPEKDEMMNDATGSKNTMMEGGNTAGVPPKDGMMTTSSGDMMQK